LTLVRFLEFIREPEALFWVFIFPILLAAGLGIAFRNRPADVLKIAAVTPQLAQSLRQEKLLDVAELPAAAAEEALRNGKVALLAVPGADGRVVYRYDDTNPEGRTARMLADRAIQRAAGRVDPVASRPISSCASPDPATSIS
jgi:ABC-2 type transport system permease protein